MKRAIVKYLLELLNYLDGRGLAITDEKLLKDTLNNDFGDFVFLQALLKK